MILMSLPASRTSSKAVFNRDTVTRKIRPARKLTIGTAARIGKFTTGEPHASGAFWCQMLAIGSRALRIRCRRRNRCGFMIDHLTIEAGGWILVDVIGEHNFALR